MTRAILHHAAVGALGLSICAGFGWCMAEVLTSINNYVDYTPKRPNTN